jgi:hypothetical protein
MVHGTFSNSKNFLKALNETKDGQKFLGRAKHQYSAGVFFFDHPTLATSPLENAIDLAGIFRKSKCSADVVAHSRGGLVVRWWQEVLCPEQNDTRCVFVGSPIAGTSLASPPQWKTLIDYLTNLGNALGTVSAGLSMALPCLHVATTLLKILGSAGSFAAKSPLSDAAVALVAGIHGQSRVGNHPGLTRLRAAGCPNRARCFAVQSDFQPDPISWKFWRIFNRPTDYLADWAAEALFQGPNDLVVDVSSMTDLSDGVRLPADHVLDFETNPDVHHTNYFAQPKLYVKLNDWLLDGTV